MRCILEDYALYKMSVFVTCQVTCVDCVYCTGFSTVHESAMYACLIHFKLDVRSKQTVGPYHFTQFQHHSGRFDDRLSISASNDGHNGTKTPESVDDHEELVPAAGSVSYLYGLAHDVCLLDAYFHPKCITAYENLSIS